MCSGGGDLKTRIVRIGNSRGIRIPKAVLEQTNIEGEVELEVQADHIVIRSPCRPRQGWADQFRKMAREGDDQLLDPEHSLSPWDEREWQW
jgi:antitoxin MazE